MYTSLTVKKLVSALFVFSFTTLSLNAQVQWQQTNGPTGGVPNTIVTGVEADFANFQSVPSDNPDMVVYRTDDNGQNWIKTDITRPILGIDSSGYYYSVTTIANEDPDTLFRSTDEGNTWVPVYTGSLNILGLMVSDSGKLYLHGPGGLLMSDNGGLIWIVTDTTDCSIVALNSQGDIFRVSTDTLELSQDDGNTWEFFMDISFALELGWWVTTMVINDQDEIFMGTRHWTLYKIATDSSSPEGNSWEEIAGMYYIYDLDISPTGTLVVLSHPGYVYRSTDNGVTWLYSYIHELLGGVEINAEDVSYAVGSEGIYTLPDPGAGFWVFPGAGLLKSSIYKMETLNDTSILASTNEILYRTNDGGNSWQYIFATDISGFTLYFFVTSNGNIITIERRFIVDWQRDGDQHQMYHSADGGMTWNEALWFVTPYYSNLVENPPGNIFMIINDMLSMEELNYIATSADYGLTWTIMPIDVSIWQLAVDSSGNLYGRGALGYYISQDNGVTWSFHAPPEYSNPLYQHLQFEISKSGVFYSVYTWAVYASYDQGQEWTMLYNNTYLNRLSFGNNGELFISGADGVHRSVDGGLTWENISEDLDNIITTEMDNSGRIYASVAYNSVWATDTWVSAKQNLSLNCTIKLYPNPATDFVTIEYQTNGKTLPVKFYSQQGQLLLENFIGPSGQLSLNLNHLPAGIYHVKIEDQVGMMVVY